MKKLKKYTEKPVIGPIIKRVIDFGINREVKTVARHFSKYLHPLVAETPELSKESFKIRHDVYCEELGFLNTSDNGFERDEFDNYSTHCLIQHIPSLQFAGTVRVVRPETAKHSLPLQTYCADSIAKDKINPADFAPYEICEISRLAVPKGFRKRHTDKFEGAATAVINKEIYSENELRCFPFIAVGLYLSAASIVLENNIKHTFVMMEPRLARSMGFIGIKFEKIGPTVDYHGKRAPYYINPSLLMESLTPGFQVMLKEIRKSLKHKE
ncbi:PEP-CTERM/exosortase system-associated acyltransferase [Paraglaciecola sp. 2405UD69-4]|uniref:PEP-CTERM/exosortase system-associated acyltransferase n=1 Tax=Paraglaciecola sp. 2405UD69-4 TaxID=3391836 RepID=UPI0039C95E70